MKIATIALASTLITSHASAKECLDSDGTQRHRSALGPCDTSPSTCSTFSSWTYAQRRDFFALQNKPTALEACQAYIANFKHTPALTQTQKSSATLVTLNATTAMCTYDYDGNGHVYGTPSSPTPSGALNDYAVFHTIIYAVTEDAEAMCSLVPHGPYTNIGSPFGSFGTPGADFSSSKRTAVMAQNKGSSSSYWSDAWIPFLWEHVDYFQQLVLWVHFPVVTHIVPRVDIKGCACGTNASSNAMVVSSKLLLELDTDSQNWKRQTLFSEFTIAPTAREIDEDFTTDADIDAAITDEEATTEIGGCSAGGSSGLAIGGIALALRRRKRARESA